MAEFDFAFKPTFEHEDWIDNQDRVQAEGPDGFNHRFRALRADLEAIGGVVDNVRKAVTALAAAPAARKEIVTLTPNLVNTAGMDPAAPGAAPATPTGWTHDPGVARKIRSARSADGMMSVSLPHGVKLTEFRAIGKNRGGSLTLELSREPLPPDATTPVTTESIATVNGAGEFFDRKNEIHERAIVDNTRFRYYITAALTNSPADAAVTLLAFQISHETT